MTVRIRFQLMLAVGSLFVVAGAGFAFRTVEKDPEGGGYRFVAVSWFNASNVVTIQDGPPPPTSDDEKSVRKLLDDQVAAWNQGDLKGFMAGYWKSPRLTFSSGRDIQRGWQATYDRYVERYQKDGNEMGSLTFGEIECEPIAGEAMLVRGRWKLELKKGPVDGLFSLIVKKLPDGWRIVHDHTSVGETKPKP